MVSSARVRPPEEADAFRSDLHEEADRIQLSRYLAEKRETLLRQNATTWTVGGEQYSAKDIQELIVLLTSEGYTLEEILSIDGMPIGLQIFRWREFNPGFEEAMVRAEEVAGQLAYEKAERIAMQATYDSKKVNPAGAKVICDLLAKRAARQNKRFQDKQTIETRDLSKLSVEDVHGRIQSMLENNGSILNLVNRLNLKGVKMIEMAKKAEETSVEDSRPENG